MKILLLFTYGISLKRWDKKGILKREITLYQKLMEKGIEFKFLTHGDYQDLEYKSLLNKIDIFPVANLIKSKNRAFRFLKSMILPFILKDMFKDVDIIKTNQVDGSWIGIIAKILYRKKLIVRGGYEWFRNHTSKSKLQKLSIKNYIKYLLSSIYIFIIEFISYNLADCIILTNKSDIEFIVKKFKLRRKRDKIKKVPNFVDFNLFKPLEKKKKDKHILYIGRLNLVKNLFNLIMAFKYLDGFTLDIIGTGPDEKILKNKVKELKINVNFLGIVPNEMLPEIINQYNIFILPSFYECNPKSLLEAMSCGISCIGTNVRGINEIIIHEENGCLCGLSANSISKTIKNLYNNKELRETIGKNARNYIINEHSLNFLVNKEFFIYKKLLNNNK